MKDLTVHMFTYVIIIWSWIKVADFSVEINTLGCSDGGSCNCNDVVTAMCTVNPYTSIMSWYEGEGAGTKLFECVGTLCYPAYTTDYDFNGDTNTGIFNMTFNPLKLSQNSNSFTCNGAGIDAKTVTLNVVVILEKADIDVGSAGTKLQVNTSKCSFDGETIVIEWRRSKTPNADNAVIYSDKLVDDSKVSVRTNCSNADNPNCGGDSTYKMNYTYTLPDYNDADEYYLFAFITYQTQTWKLQLDGMYRLNVQDTDNSTSSTTKQMNCTSSSPTSSCSTSPYITTTTTDRPKCVITPYIYLIVGMVLLIIVIGSFVTHVVFIFVKGQKRKDKTLGNSKPIEQTVENTYL